jgi:protein-arginine kinase activator protein McsA
MGKVSVEKLPKCDVCQKQAAKYDVPLPASGNHWGYVCEACAKMQDVGEDQINLGTTFEVRERKPATGEVVVGDEPGPNDLDYWEDATLNDLRTILCPKCGEEHHMELDAAASTKKCGCGVMIKIQGNPFM